MTQSYNTLNETDELVDSRSVINNNILTALTSSASSTVPTTDVEDGRPFYNNATDIYYMYSKDAWKALFDCSGSVARAMDSARLGGQDSSQFPRVSTRNYYQQNQVLNNNRALAIRSSTNTELNVVTINSGDSLQFGNTSVVPTMYYPNGSYPLVHNGTSSFKIYHEGNPPPAVPIGSHNHDTEYLAIDGIAADAYTARKLFNKSLSSAANNYDVVTYVKTDGSLSIGNSIYFHESDSDARDWSTKIEQLYLEDYPEGGASATGIIVKPAVDMANNIGCDISLFNVAWAGVSASNVRCTDHSNLGARLGLSTVNRDGTHNALTLYNPDTPDLGPGDVLQYSTTFGKSVPVIEAWIWGTGVFKGLSNDANQTGFQMLIGSTDGALNGYVTMTELTNVYYAVVCGKVDTSNSVVAHVRSIVGNQVHYHCSSPGTDNVHIMAFGVSV
jgi:hypothetical protein